MNRPLAAGIAFSFIILGTVHAQVEAPPPAPTQNALVAFGSPAMQQMRERLEDPVQRASMRAEQRADLIQSHADVGRIIGIDAARQSELIELLADLYIEQLESFHLRMQNRTAGPAVLDEQAARQTRRIEGLRTLLDEPQLENYQAFEKTLSQRSQVNRFNARLDRAHKLTAEQTEQMIVFHAANLARSLDQPPLSLRRLFPRSFQGPSTPQDLQRQSQLMTIESNEDLWRRLPDDHRALREQAATVLTAPQLETLSQLQSEELAERQRQIEQMRAHAGLDPQIPAAPDTPPEAAPTRTARGGDIKISIRVAIDRKAPAVFSQVVRNGSLVTFEAGGGLSVTATPTLYEDGKFDLRLTYLEAGTHGRRVIGESRQLGELRNQPASLDRGYSGGSASVIVGRKGYVVELDTRVEPI